jgi:hypothetical protein
MSGDNRLSLSRSDSQPLRDHENLNRFTEAMNQQHTAVLRLEEKLRGTEAALLASIQQQPLGASASASSLGSANSANIASLGDEVLNPSQSHTQLRRSSSNGQVRSGDNSDSSVLSPLLKSIWKQFDGLSSQPQQQQTSSSAPESNRIAHSIARWEHKLQNEVLKMEAAKKALKEEKKAISLKHTKLAQRRSEWKDRTKRVRSDDYRSKQILKVHYSSRKCFQILPAMRV